ncbi:MAG: helix-turn-helix transcriptional regulator, partial [Eubacteriales bacterium]
MEQQINDINIKMGVRIQDIRKERGISQMQLANEIEISSRGLSFIETGRNEGRLNTLIKIAEYFNVSLDFLAFGKEEEWLEGLNELPECDKNKIKQTTQSMIKIFAESDFGSIIFFVGLPPRNIFITSATLDRMQKQCCLFITDGEEL